jgi:hypothetical protein
MPFWRLRKKEQSNDFLIRDGIIIDTDQPEACDPEPEEEFPKFPPPLPPQPIKKIEPEPLQNPPTAAYLPCFITDGSQSDYGGFVHFLEHMQVSDRYRSEQAINLKVWARKLCGRIDAESIQDVVKNPGRAGQMMAALRNYARYRDLHGDPRLLITLSRIKIKRPAKYKPKKVEKLTADQVGMYRNQAQKLCREENRNGVFLGLLLLGISPTEIHGLELVNNMIRIKRKNEKLLIDAPAWLMRAMTTIPEKKWRKKRGTVIKEVKAYAITPREILMSVDCRISNIIANS